MHIVVYHLGLTAASASAYANHIDDVAVRYGPLDPIVLVGAQLEIKQAIHKVPWEALKSKYPQVCVYVACVYHHIFYLRINFFLCVNCSW